MKKIIRLTESDLTRIVKKILKETTQTSQEAFAKKNQYGLCLTVGEKFSTAWGEYNVGLTNKELKSVDPNGYCSKTMRGKPDRENIMACVSALCELKTNSTASTDANRIKATYNCYVNQYKQDYDVMSVMC